MHEYCRRPSKSPAPAAMTTLPPNRGNSFFTSKCFAWFHLRIIEARAQRYRSLNVKEISRRNANANRRIARLRARRPGLLLHILCGGNDIGPGIGIRCTVIPGPGHQTAGLPDAAGFWQRSKISDPSGSIQSRPASTQRGGKEQKLSTVAIRFRH